MHRPPPRRHGAAAPTAAPQVPQKPKVVAKPQPPVQKPYALLSDAQIAGIKERLKLSPSQVSIGRRWKPRCAELPWQDPREAASPIPPLPRADRSRRRRSPALKSAAMPLLFQLREDQKREVRTLARVIGLEKVASMI